MVMPPRNWRYTSGLIFGMLLGVLIAIGLMLLKPVDRMHEITALLGSSGIGAAVGIAAVAMRNRRASAAFRALEARRGYDPRQKRK